MSNYDLIIIGGGYAGLMAAIAAKEEGVENILILEREEQLGGSLNYCIDLDYTYEGYGELLTGPELAQIYIDRVREHKIDISLNSLAIELNKDRAITVVSKSGIRELKAKAVVLAAGSREKPRGIINIPGSKAAGILTAGTAERFVNLEGYLPGKQVLIIGSGDTGLIIAKRLTLEGAAVKAVVEPLSYAVGTSENIEQCLNAFDIPLKLGYTAVDIKGVDRVQGVTLSKLDADNMPVEGTEEYIVCDTIIISANLLPETELLFKAGASISNITGGAVVNSNMQTSLEGVFACGDVLYIHSYREDIMQEARRAGQCAALYLKKELAEKK